MVDHLTVKLAVAFDGKLSLVSQIVCHTGNQQIVKIRNQFEEDFNNNCKVKTMCMLLCSILVRLSSYVKMK